jgi:hypothetical protein
MRARCMPVCHKVCTLPRDKICRSLSYHTGYRRGAIRLLTVQEMEYGYELGFSISVDHNSALDHSHRQLYILCMNSTHLDELLAACQVDL